MTIRVIVKSGGDYRRLLKELPEEGYDCSGTAGQRVMTMADGTIATFEIDVDTGTWDREFHEYVDEVADGSIEFRPQ